MPVSEVGVVMSMAIGTEGTELGQFGGAEAEIVVDARGHLTRELNSYLLSQVRAGARRLRVENLTGQRYIGTNLGTGAGAGAGAGTAGATNPGSDTGTNRGTAAVKLRLYGTPGNDLGAFLDGPEIEVMGNAQDGVGNTMNRGRIVIHGNAGDILAMSARGGEIFVRGKVGYRACLHMKEYEGRGPLVVVGGTAQDFFGEYMAGGTAVLLGLGLELGLGPRSDPGEAAPRRDAAASLPVHKILYLATGMHGGRIYIRGEFDRTDLGSQVDVAPVNGPENEPILAHALDEFTRIFADTLSDGERQLLAAGPYYRLQPKGKRPYGRMYA